MAVSSSSRSKSFITTSIAIADAASWCCAFILFTMLLQAAIREEDTPQLEEEEDYNIPSYNNNYQALIRGNFFIDRVCDEIYVVREGETLQTIGEKCDDPFIVERNPHIHDPDDVFPGLVIKITSPTKMSRRI